MPTSTARWMLLCFTLTSATACVDAGATDDDVDEGDGSASRIAGCEALSSAVAAGVLATVNAAEVDVDALDRSTATGGAGLSSRAAQSIVAARPFADMTALDAAQWVGPATCRDLARWSCNVRGACDLEVAIATWNVEHFPKSSATETGVVSVIEQLDLAFTAMQEIEAQAPFDRVVDRLDAAAGELGEAADTRVGAIIDERVFDVIEVEQIFTHDSYAFPRPVLAVTVRLIMAPDIEPFTVVVVHLKAQSDDKSRERRRAGITALRGWIDERRDDGDGRIVVLGDFNDQIDDVGVQDVFGPLLDDASAETIALTEVLLDQPDAFSYVPFTRLIDHVLVTQELLTDLDVEEVTAVPLEQTWNGDYLADISDHRPVMVRLRVPVGFDG